MKRRSTATGEYKMMLVLADCWIDHSYITLINNVYGTAACVRLHEDVNKFRIEQGVRQGYTISPKLFTAILYMYKQVDFADNIGVNINSKDLLMISSSYLIVWIKQQKFWKDFTKLR